MKDKNELDTFLDFTDLKKHKSTMLPSPSETNDDQVLLKSFEDLRKKLKASQKENCHMREDIKIQGIRLKQNQQALQIALGSNVELKSHLQKQYQVNSQLRQMLCNMKQQLKKHNALEEELAFTKQALLESKLKEKSLCEERQKGMALFLDEKMQLEQEISRLKARNTSDQQFISHLEQESAQTKEHSIRLQNKVRKMSISFEQNTFNHNFRQDNFQTQHQTQTITQLQNQIQILKSKLSKERDRRYLLEQQLIHFQETAGINHVKANTFEGETEMLAQKQGKLNRKIDDLSSKLQRVSEEKIVIEEDMIKYRMFSEELIAKLQPLMSEDLEDIMMYYAKKLNNMTSREEETGVMPLSASKHPNMLSRNQPKTPLQEHHPYNTNTTTPFLTNYQTNPTERYASVGKKDSLDRSGGRETRMTFGQGKQNQVQAKVLQARIRREREQMQKKLKQKWFQKKFECSMPSQLYKLRAEYITTFIDK